MLREAELRPAAAHEVKTASGGEEYLSSRRMLLTGGVAAMTAAAGLGLPFTAGKDTGFMLVGICARRAGIGRSTEGAQTLDYPGKDKGLAVLGDRPLVAETPESLLDDDTTPNAKFFIRNNGHIPEDNKQGDAWTFKVEGEVDRPLTLSVAELRSRFTPQTMRMVMECGGNGRSFFQPSTRGNPWTNGGAGCAAWTGVKLADVLKAAGLKENAKFTGHYGADPHLSGDTTKDAISRGMPLEKALEPHTMLVWAMNGEPLPHIHGGPLRLIVPGWPGSLSSKWLTRVLVRPESPRRSGHGRNVIPRADGPDHSGIERRRKDQLHRHDLDADPLDHHRAGERRPRCRGYAALPIRGAAWDGDNDIQKVEVSVDAGQRWLPMDMAKPKNRYDWVRWSGTLALPSDGYFELWVRATDCAASPNRMWRRTGTRKDTARTHSIALRCWSVEHAAELLRGGRVCDRPHRGIHCGSRSPKRDGDRKDPGTRCPISRDATRPSAIASAAIRSRLSAARAWIAHVGTRRCVS